MQKKHLRTPDFKSTPDGLKFNDELADAVRPVLDKYIQKGFDIYEMEHIAMNEISVHFLNYMITEGIEIRKNKREQLKQVKELLDEVK